MAWGARQEEDGTWRICERRGRTIKYPAADRRHIEIHFPGRAKAEQCAHTLNEHFWEAYDRCRKKDQPMPFAWEILKIIRDHEGITAEDWEKL